MFTNITRFITFTLTITSIPKNPLLHTPFSINSLHSHLHLFLFQRSLLLQTLAPNLHSHLQVSCHSINLVLLVLDIRLDTLTFKLFTASGTQVFAYG